MKVEIKNRFNEKIMISGEYESIRDALEKNRGADLRGAYLHGADLDGVNLRDAVLGGNKICILYASSYPLQYTAMFGTLKIGCEVHHLEYWLIMYDVIGRENGFTEAQIKEYHVYIKMLKELK